MRTKKYSQTAGAGQTARRSASTKKTCCATDDCCKGSGCECRCECHHSGCECCQPALGGCQCGCDCCRPGQGGPTCPPPERPPQPGVVDLPQDPPPSFPPASTPPWKEGKPAPDSPGEIPWFRGKIDEIDRKGPRFGPRKDEYLPYLLVRAASGDRGARPYSGVFWESPDIFVAPNLDAGLAPLFPPTSGDVAQANRPNTLYAHVWNLGKSPAYRVRVEFYWFNPSLGISFADAHLIGAAWIDLANRFTVNNSWTVMDDPSGSYITRGSHAIVRCPVSWIPSYENQGHECLVVRAFEPVFDSLDPAQFSAAADRHVGQRNIAVVLSSSPAALDLNLSLGYLGEPGEAEVEIELAAPQAMEWLRLYTGQSDPGLHTPAAPVVAGLLPPAIAGGRLAQISALPIDQRAALLSRAERFSRGCDPLQIGLHASIANLAKKEAQVVRVRQKVNGDLVGGYTVVLLGH